MLNGFPKCLHYLALPESTPSLLSSPVSAGAAVSIQLPLPDTVRGPSPDLGPVLGSSPDASPQLKLNFSFTLMVSIYRAPNMSRGKDTTAEKKLRAMTALMDLII